ncbi:MAG: DNA/RNA nuclease SfsA [Thermodesulforhabdaceae bacterium]
MFYRAVFIRRINRFEVECLVDGRILEAYLPNPGRLWEILLPGKELYLKESAGTGKHQFTVWAARRYGSPVLLHTHYTNDVAELFLRKGIIPGLEKFVIKSREVPIKGGRIDFLMENPAGVKLLLEVKSCTLFGDRIAMFPDAVTDRGKKHIEKLAGVTLADSNVKAGVLFMVHAPHVDDFLPDFHTDPAFSRTLYENRHTLMLKAISIRWDDDLQPWFVKDLNIAWPVYEKEARDRGSYLLLGFLPENLTLSVGSIGERFFRKGFYVYVGSAMNSLSQRINRHLRRKKSLHWHIDMLTPFLKKLTPLRIESSERLECLIAKRLCSIADSTVSRFGSSDCNCPGHLFWMISNPLYRESFIKLLVDFRINRLFPWHPDNALK